MATNFSLFYKARIVKAVVGHGTKRLHALGYKSTSKSYTPSLVTDAIVRATATASVFGTLASGDIYFGRPVKDGNGVKVSNSSASDQLTIAAGSTVWVVAIVWGTGGSATVRAWVDLTTPLSNYKYEEQGTLTVPDGGYSVKHS